jgi:hypothetical protein
MCSVIACRQHYMFTTVFPQMLQFLGTYPEMKQMLQNCDAVHIFFKLYASNPNHAASVDLCNHYYQFSQSIKEGIFYQIWSMFQGIPCALELVIIHLCLRFPWSECGEINTDSDPEILILTHEFVTKWLGSIKISVWSMPWDHGSINLINLLIYLNIYLELWKPMLNLISPINIGNSCLFSRTHVLICSFPCGKLCI